MNVEVMRSKISKVYDGPKWKERVKWMPDNQVMAIYFSFKQQGVFDIPTVKSKLKEPEEIQISIWDVLKEKEKANERT